MKGIASKASKKSFIRKLLIKKKFSSNVFIYLIFLSRFLWLVMMMMIDALFVYYLSHTLCQIHFAPSSKKISV